MKKTYLFAAALLLAASQHVSAQGWIQTGLTDCSVNCIVFNDYGNNIWTGTNNGTVHQAKITKE